jgi:predicted membrane channel-forming protein YqfA (hemolysin III family)
MNKITFNLPPLVERQAAQREGVLAYCQDAECAVSALPHALHRTPGAMPMDAPALAPPRVQLSPASFTFTLGRVGAAGAGAVLGGVARVTPAPVSAAALRLQKTLLPDPAPEECEYRDQYSVGDPQYPKKGCSRFCELFHGVAFSNDVSMRVGTISSLLGPTGHYERLSFWTHFAGAFAFAAYATVRQVLVRDDARLAGGLTSAAAWTIAVVFLTSSLYHCTAPDLNFAMVTRVLDYAAIYIGITVTTTADIAVATRGFVHVPAQTVVDLPASAVILIVFFVWRRSRLPGESTWTKHEITSRSKDGCLLGRGLFSYGHRDLAHIQMRQSTSLLLFGSYFMVVPAAMEVLGHGVARVVLALQICAFVTVALGMAIDRVFEFPDGNLVEGSMTCLACPNTFGAVLNSHALWHLIAMVSAGLTVASREYALAYS